MSSETPAPSLKADIALYKRLLAYLRPYKTQFALVVVSMIVTGLAEPALAALVKPLLDGSFVEKDPFYITYVPIALLAVVLLRALGNFVISVGMNWVTEKVTVDLRNEIFAKLVTLPTSYYEAHSTGKIIAKLLHHVNQMKMTATQTLVPLIRDSVTVIALLSWMLYLNWKLSLTILVLAPFIVLVVSIVSRRLRVLSRRMQTAVSTMTQTVDESVRNHKAVKIFLAQEQEKQRASESFNALRRLGFKFAVASGANAIIIQGLSAVALASVVYFSSLQSLEGEVSVGGFVSFFGAMALLLSPIKRLAAINQTLQQGLAGAESIFGTIDLDPEPNGGDKLPTGDTRGKLEFRKVSFFYPGQDDPALKDVSFTVEPNETVAIVGLSGSGKSTIASLIPLLHRPSSGQIVIDGIDTREMPIRELRKQISYVSQEILLFNDSIKHNIAYGCMQDCSDDQVKQAAEAAYTNDFVSQLPEGLDTPVGQSGALLSGGQRQRIVIARTILKDSPIMIFDEATSALDATSEQKIQKALRGLADNRTLIIIAHRLSTIEHADRIIVIDKGSVAEAGSHKQLIAKNGIYARLHALSKQDHLPDTPQEA